MKNKDLRARGPTRSHRWTLGLLFILIFSSQALQAQEDAPLPPLTLPAGFHIDYFARDVPGARSLAQSPQGLVFVGTRNQGKVWALFDADGNGKAERKILIASGLNQPNGVAFLKGNLFVAEISRLLCFDSIEQNLNSPPAPRVIKGDLPPERHHGWKFISFGPDGKLYVPVGAPCNICENANPLFATLTRLNPDGSGFEIFAKGIRNTVGFDWHPQTKILYFTDNGRDWAGNNQPPDELNGAPQAGMHFGFPYCHGQKLADPEYGNNKDCRQFSPPVRELGPHVAALGMRFYTGSLFPPEYKNRIFIAEHGSWNRQPKIGYRVSQVILREGAKPLYLPFIEGWLKNDQSVWGRPVDVLVAKDGSLLVSDDYQGSVYRVTYRRK